MATTLHPNTIKLGQTNLTTEQMRLMKLALNASNVVYNADLPGELLQGAALTNQRDLRMNAGIDQPYASEPGWSIVDKVVDIGTGGKAVVFRNADTNEVMVAFAGMDGVGNGRDQGSGVVYNATNQTNALKGALQDILQEMAISGDLNANTSIIVTGQSMGAANAINFSSLLVTTNNQSRLNLGGLSVNPSRVTLLGFNGEGSTDAASMAMSGMTLAQLGNTGIGQIFATVGSANDSRGWFDIVTSLLKYPLPEGAGLVVLPPDFASRKDISGLHSTHTGLMPAFKAVIDGNGTIKIEGQTVFVPGEVISIGRYIATLGDPSPNMGYAEGYVRTAVMGAVVGVLDYTPGSGTLIGVALKQELDAPMSISKIMGWGSELLLKGFALTQPGIFLKMIVAGLGVAAWLDPGDADLPSRLALAGAMRPALPGVEREIYENPENGEWFVYDVIPGVSQVLFDKFGNVSEYDLVNRTSKHTSASQNIVVKRDDSG